MTMFCLNKENCYSNTFTCYPVVILLLLLNNCGSRDVPDIPQRPYPNLQDQFFEDVFDSEQYEGSNVFNEGLPSSKNEKQQDHSSDLNGDGNWELLQSEVQKEEQVDYMYPDSETELQMSQDIRMREERLRTVAANVEVLAVIDYSIYRKYLKEHQNRRKALKQLKQYYTILFNMVNQRFSTIQSPTLTIRVTLVDVIILQSRREASWLEYSVVWPRTVRHGMVSVDTALQKFQMWLRRKYTNLPRYDHAVAFTRHRLHKGFRMVDGVAYIGSICRSLEGKSASVVFDNGDFLAVGITAHELGHSLGATHDGDRHNPSCFATNNNIMAPSHITKMDGTVSLFYFSKCSIRQMNIHLSSRTCLSDGTRTRHYQDDGRSPGSIYGLTKQCQLVFGQQSDFCPRPDRQQNICAHLWCVNPSNRKICQTKSRLVALPGTVCSPHKVCHLGRCLDPSPIEQYNRRKNMINTPPTIDCPAGDKDISYCDSLTTKHGRDQICRHALIRAYCCQTCSSAI